MASRNTPNNNNTIGDFQILAHLGDGSYSSVYKVKRISDGQVYALKKVKMMALSDKEKENALNEVRILASLSDPHVIGYKEAFFDDSTMALCLIMTYAGGGDAYQKIVEHQRRGSCFPEKDIWRYLYHMVRGLRSLHKLNILHRDLKSANIFLSSDGYFALLGDLNVSKVAKNNLVYTQTGTPYYASPEVWKDQPYDKKSDIWSLGCVIYELAALKPPFRAQDMGGLFKKVQKGLYDKLPARYSAELSKVIACCLKVLPNQRPNCDDLLDMLEVRKNCHEFMDDTEEVEPQPGSLFRPALLNTIKVPKNLRAVTLPKPNYGPVAKKKDDNSFLPPIVSADPRMKSKLAPGRVYTRQTAPNDESVIMPIHRGPTPRSMPQNDGPGAPKPSSRKYKLPVSVQHQLEMKGHLPTPKALEQKNEIPPYNQITRKDSNKIYSSIENDKQAGYSRGKVASRQREENLVAKPLQAQNLINEPQIMPRKDNRYIPPLQSQARSPPAEDRALARQELARNELMVKAQNILQAQAQAHPQVPQIAKANSPVVPIGIYNNKNLNYYENSYDYDAMISKKSPAPALMNHQQQQQQVHNGQSRKSAYPDWWG